MKKSFLALFSFFIGLSGFTQYNQQIILKWAPASIAAGKITVGGEYNFKRRNSVEFFIGIPTEVNRPFVYDNTSNSLHSKAFSVMAGYRYYPGKKDASGIYLEPYAKYLHHQANGILQGTVNGQTVKFDTHSDYTGVGIGAQLGVQFIIAKRFRLDLFLLGPEANSSNFSSVSRDVTNNIPWTLIQATEAQKDVKDALKNIPVIGDKVQVQVDQNNRTVSTKYDGFMPGLRFGASVGISL